MGFDSDKKLTKYTSAVTIVTDEVANMWAGGLYGTLEGDEAQAKTEEEVGSWAVHPLVGGHAHDGDHADGHAQKINLVKHVTDQLLNINLGTEAVDDRTVSMHLHEGDAIPYWTEVGGVRYYKLDLSMAKLGGGAGAFTEHDSTGDGVNDLIKTTSEDYSSTGMDFVFGSDTKYAHPDAALGEGINRVVYSREEGYFRAGTATESQWDALECGAASVGLGHNPKVSGEASSILGGRTNEVESIGSSISGGVLNLIAQGADHSNIGGGTGNVVGAEYSSVLGGEDNQIGPGGPHHSVMLGGSTNRILTTSGSLSFIGVGANNLVDVLGTSGNQIMSGQSCGIMNDSEWCLVVSGKQNLISGGLAPAELSIIVGGTNNKIEDTIGATIVGGAGNEVLDASLASFVGGGEQNKIENSSHHSSVVGGESNVIGEASAITETSHSFIGGGLSHKIMGVVPTNLAFIGGGEYNRIVGIQNVTVASSICGGKDGLIEDSYCSFIGGGTGNIITESTSSLIVGGSANIISKTGTYGAGTSENAIVGGLGNEIHYSKLNAILGGYKNIVMSQAVMTYNFIGGGRGNEMISELIASGDAVDSGPIRASVISGGLDNRIRSGGDPASVVEYAGIISGLGNVIINDRGALEFPREFAGQVICGGVENIIHSTGNHAFIGGGSSNLHSPCSNSLVDPNAGINMCSMIAGGLQNKIYGSDYSVISGGGGPDGGGVDDGNHIYGGVSQAGVPSSHNFIGSGHSNRIGDSATADPATGANNNYVIGCSIVNGDANIIGHSTGQTSLMNQILSGGANQILSGSLNTIINGTNNLIIHECSKSMIMWGADNLIKKGTYNVAAGENMCIEGLLDPPSVMHKSFLVGYSDAPTTGTPVALRPYDSLAPSGIRNSGVFVIGPALDSNLPFNVEKMVVGINTSQPSPAPHGADAAGLHIVGPQGVGSDPFTPLRMTNLQETASWTHVLVVDTQADGNTYVVNQTQLSDALANPQGVGHPKHIRENDNVTDLANDAGYVASGDNISELNNDSGYVALGDDITNLNNNAGYITDGVQVGDNVSVLVNDSGYTTIVDVNAAVAPIAADINVEIARATLVEATIQADVDQNEADSDAESAAIAGDLVAEVARAEAVEVALQVDVSQNEADVTTEVARAIAAEAVLQANIDNSVQVGDNVSGLSNDSGYLTNAMQVGDNVSDLANDAGYLTQAAAPLSETIVIDFTPGQQVLDDEVGLGVFINNYMIEAVGDIGGNSSTLILKPGQLWQAGMSFHIMNNADKPVILSAVQDANYVLNGVTSGTYAMNPGNLVQVFVFIDGATKRFSVG